VGSLRQRCQVVAAVAALTEDAPADQCTQQPAQRVWVRADRARQFTDPERLFGQGIGDAQLGGDGDGLRQPRASNELHHHGRRRSRRLMKPQEVMTGPLDHADQWDRWNLGRDGHALEDFMEA
jgi:hypothetical protein